MENLPNTESTIPENQTPEQSVVYTGEMIANMTDEELAQHSAAIEAQFENMQSEEDYQKAIANSQNTVEPPQEPSTGSTNEPSNEPNSEGTTEPANPVETDNNVLSDEEFRKFVTNTFKANGREVSVDDPKDIIRLMQQGFNYQKKMADLKPQKRILKTLEQHGLLDENKLNQAIEILAGKPEAIAQFLKDRNIDTFELPDVSEQPHQFGNYLVNENQVTFEEKIQELQNSNHGNEVLGLIQRLNNEDFAEVFNNQHIIDDLKFHADSGLMSDALSQLEKDQALGRVPANMSFLNAYNAISNYLYTQNQAKYNPNKPKVIGNNIQTEPQQPVNTVNKTAAGIPNNHQQTTVEKPELTPQEIQHIIATADPAELDKYSSFEDFLVAKSNVKFRN